MKKNKIYLITWLDACGHDGEFDARDVGKGMVLRDVGYLVKESEDMITISPTWCEKDKNWRGYIDIPRVLIKRIKEIK